MQAGYDPASFGSYSHVQALTERAKQRVAYYKRLKTEGNPTADEFRPPEADFQLAECEAVLLATDPQRAPSDMPARAALGPSTVPGTEANNAHRADANGSDEGDSAQQAVEGRAGEKPKLTRKEATPARSKAELAKEAAQRAKIDEAIGDQQRAGGNQGQASPRSKGKSTKEINGKTAGECIDNFVKQSLADLDSNKSNSSKVDEGIADGGEGGGGSEVDGGHATWESAPPSLKSEMSATPSKIHMGKQGKHIPGHNNFQPGKSELTHPDPQSLLDKGTGTGVRHGTKEVVDFREEIGTYVALDGTRMTTTRGTIHNDSKGNAHIVPADPNPTRPEGEP